MRLKVGLRVQRILGAGGAAHPFEGQRPLVFELDEDRAAARYKGVWDQVCNPAPASTTRNTEAAIQR